MDGQQFDQVARLIGAGASRRRVLKGILGGIAASVAVTWGREGALAGCQSLGDECDPEIIGHCCGNQCLPAVGDGPAFTCQTACASVGDACSTVGGDGLPGCCEGWVCTEGVCTEIAGPGCASDFDCDPCNACIEGVCTGLCAGLCESCDAASGEHGTCVFDCRAAEGTGCCGNDVTCNQETGTCEAPNVPDPVCKGDSDCAVGTCCCKDGTCASDCCPVDVPTDDVPKDEIPDVTTLPNTGIGDSDGGNALLGAALAAGAAAVLTARKLRPADDQDLVGNGALLNE